MVSQIDEIPFFSSRICPSVDIHAPYFSLAGQKGGSVGNFCFQKSISAEIQLHLPLLLSSPLLSSFSHLKETFEFNLTNSYMKFPMA